MWRGIDGSEILTNFITARDATMPFEDDKHTRYNGYTTPSYVMGAWQRFQDKAYSNEVIVPFGYGDGGGSANEEMLEILERTQKGIAGFPKTKTTSIKEYAKTIKENFENACKALGEVPKWVGELYLELHRGTFTSMSEIKKFNRYCEFLYQKAEQLSILGKELFGQEYPKEDLEKGWKNILLNQFHDILPGSSIKEVYDDAFALYEEACDFGEKVCLDKLSTIAKNVSAKDGVLVYNANSFATAPGTLIVIVPVKDSF
jgi:alpha-mannosidase